MNSFGLLGGNLSHSYSPQIHALLGDYEYKLYEKRSDELEGFFRDFSLDAINVTIPHKKDVIPFCDTISPTAARIGSVNTIVNRGGKLEGHNTDYYGFSRMLSSCPVKVSGAKAIVLGSGGASVTVQAVLNDLGAAEIAVISRGGENNYGNIYKHADADIIVNTTPVGMYPNNGVSPIALGDFPRCGAVLDLIYNPARTRLLLDAEEREIHYANGLTMLVAQALKSAELFLDTEIPETRIADITEKMLSQMGNIILIGMPGCGKSTVGKIVSEITGKSFFDCDEEIVRKAGKAIPEIFDEHGEEYFRKLETEMLGELSKMSSAVIATGGGCVTRKENYPLLHQNGTIIWLNRDLNALPSDNRPLSQAKGAAALYESRKEQYNAFADKVIDSDGDIQKIAERIGEMFI